jgi:uncharacterized membrane protein
MAQSSHSEPLPKLAYGNREKRERPWLNILLALFYLGLLAALVFLPGATLIERLRWLDSGVCAQLPGHSFFPGGQQLPLCARNTGIYLGFIVTLLTLIATGRGRAQQLPRWPIIVALLVGVLAMAIDGFNSLYRDFGLSYLYEPHNLLRLATGLATGLALATISLPIVNYLFWRESNEQRSVGSWSALLLLLPGLVLSFFAVASQSWIVLYPIALLSTAGLVSVVSGINLMIIVAIRKRDQAFERYREILPFFSIALLLAIGELLVLAQLKFVVLQTLGLNLGM